LDQPFDYFVELREIIDLLDPIQLEANRLIYDVAASRGLILLHST
jgi:hypothetical protein